MGALTVTGAAAERGGKICLDGPSRMVKRPTGSGGEPSSPNCGASAGVKARQLIPFLRPLDRALRFLVVLEHCPRRHACSRAVSETELRRKPKTKLQGKQHPISAQRTGLHRRSADPGRPRTPTSWLPVFQAVPACASAIAQGCRALNWAPRSRGSCFDVPCDVLLFWSGSSDETPTLSKTLRNFRVF